MIEYWCSVILMTLRRLLIPYRWRALPCCCPGVIIHFPMSFRSFERPLHLVFAPFNLRDAQHPLRLYQDTAANCIELEEFLRKATQ